MAHGSDAPQVFPGDSVTLVLKTEKLVTGAIDAFSPELSELKLRIAERKQIRVPTNDLAYIAFRRRPGGRVAASRSLAPHKVHLRGGHSVDVLLQPGLPPTQFGFRAASIESDPEYREFFFFAHAVSSVERTEPRRATPTPSGSDGSIGQMLVETLSATESDITHALHLQKQRNRRIGELLVEEGLVTPGQIELATAEQQRGRSRRIGEVLLDLKLVDEKVLMRTLARKFDLRFVDLDAEPPNFDAARDIPREIIAKYGILPIEKSAKALIIALSDPLALEGIDEVRFLTEQRLEEVLATPSALRRRIEDFLGNASKLPPRAGDSGLETAVRRLDETPATSEEPDDVTGVGDPTDSAIVELVNQIIADGCRRGASDIHVEPNGRNEDMIIRFRVDGECAVVQTIPARHRHAVVARIKIMARLDIAERRKPQDGKIRFRLSDRQVELRVATLPTVNGNEDVVMRILAANEPIPVGKLGLSARNSEALTRLVQKPYGLILCVGPTGSGKTTTLHSLLGSINTPDNKIWTAEDPVEITQKGLRQVQVNPRIGFTFAQAMRAFLRADPDVIMIGEMRDGETATTGVEASLTGHLVFSTLHTNSAPETVTRLLDMGLDPFNFADALLGVLAQRLARRLCARCRTSARPSAELSRVLLDAYGGLANFARHYPAVSPGSIPLFEAAGCEHCGGTGYKGRIGLHELLVTSESIKAAVLTRAPVAELRRLSCAEGMKTLVQDGIDKALNGETDLKQVLAVCQ